MAANNKIEIEITAIDRASAVFRRASSSVRTFAVDANNGMIRANNALRSYNYTMTGFNSVVRSALRNAGDAVRNFTEDAIRQFARLEKQHAKTMGAMASDYDFNWSGHNTPAQIENKNRFHADSNALMQQAYAIGSRGPTGVGSLYDPTEIASAQTALIKAGVSPEDILHTNALTDVIKFAGGNDLDVDKAVEFAVQLGTQFKIKPGDWGGMLDQVTYAANASVIDVEDIIASMKYAGNLSSGFDQPLSDILTALAIMGNSGLKGSQAGTGIAAIFTRGMSPTGISGAGAPPTKNVEQIYSDFSDRVTDDNGMFLGLGNFTEQLTSIYSDLTDEELAWFNKKLFGMFQMKAALALGRPNEDGGQIFEEMANSIVNNSPGTNDAIYDIMIASSGGQLEAVGNAYTAVKQQFGEGLSPITKEVTRQMIRALSTGDYTFDFNSLRRSIDDAKVILDKKMGRGIADAVSDIGNFALDTMQIGGANLSLFTGTGDAILKLFGGDFSGAWETFSGHIKDVNDNIDELPQDLQDTARGFRNLILTLEALFGLNIATKFGEMATSVYKLFAGSKMRTNVKSATTTVSSAKSTINTIGQTNAIVQNLLAKTNVMYVQAGTVFVSGGGGMGFRGGGGSPTLGGGGSPLPILGGGGGTLGLPGSILTGMNLGMGLNLGSQMLRGTPLLSLGAAGAGTVGALSSGSSAIALPAAAGAGTVGTGSIMATASRALGLAGGIGLLLPLSGSTANSNRTYMDLYNAGINKGMHGNELRQFIIDNAPSSPTGPQENRTQIGRDMAAKWYDETMSSAAFISSSTGMQSLYDSMKKQIDSGGKINEKFLSDFFASNGIAGNQDILTEMLNNMFSGRYKKPWVFAGSYADNSVDKFVRGNIDKTRDWSGVGTHDEVLAAMTGTISTMTTASVSLSDAVKQLLDNKINIAGLGRGPMSDEDAYNYIMGQLGSGGGIAANNELLQQVVDRFAAFDPTTEINLQNPAPVVNVNVDVDVDKSGNVSKKVIQSFGGINNWLFTLSKRFGTTSNRG